MPRARRANIGRRTRHASQQQVYSQNLSVERQNIMRENARLRQHVSTRRSLASYNRLAFQYDPTENYCDDDNLDSGPMTTVCRVYRNPLKFQKEMGGLCCASGKVKLDPLLTQPQTLKPLFDGTDPDSNHFLQRILDYNNCFRMTPFGANIIREGGFIPTCKKEMSDVIELIAAKVANDNISSTNADDEVRKSPNPSSTLKRNTQNESPHQTENVDKASKANELDKFKRRLIRVIARSMLIEKKPEEQLWQELKKETSCDCKLLWTRMRAVTLKKLKRLFAADDKIDNITKIAQLSVTDWLLFDLVLVHENVDVIGQEEIDENKRKKDPKILEDLFHLVVKYRIESLTGEALTKAWYDLTQEYNSCGRKCSPMLLQRRWFQLKELVCYNFYNFWYTYRGDSRRLPEACHYKPTTLQMEIIKRYNRIVTKEFQTWKKLIEEKKVSLHADFERLHLSRKKEASKESEPDLVVIEPHVETIDLRVESDSESESIAENKNTKDEVDVSIVKVETVDIMSDRDDDDVCVLEPVQKLHQTIETQIVYDKDDEKSGIGDIVESNAVITVNDEETCGEQLEEATKTKIEIEIDIKRLDDENKEIIIKDTDGQVKDVIKMDIEDISDTKSITVTESQLESENFTDCEAVSQSSFSDLRFIDGLELEDEGIEYFEEDDDVPERADGRDENDKVFIDTNDVRVSKIDFKLLLNPVVETKRLDDMDVFRSIDYTSVKDGRIIQNALLENSPLPKKVYNINEISNNFQHEYEDTCSDKDSNEYDIEEPININSWYFRKPKICAYNPIQLCKNPDFNTRLKRLTAGFFSSERNRWLLGQCKPVTIDMHKSFETKLRNNSLLVTSHNKPIMNCDKSFVLSAPTVTIEKTPETIVPAVETSSLAVIDNITLPYVQHDKDSIQSTMPQRYSPMMATLTPNCIKKETPEIEKEKNIANLTDIEKNRLANEKLLVAEVSPILSVNNTSKPSVRLICNKQMNIESIAKLNKNPVSLLRPNKLYNNINTLNDRPSISHINATTADQALVTNIEDGKKIPIEFDLLEKPNLKNAKPKATQPPPPPPQQSKVIPEFVKKGVPTDRLLALDTVDRILKICEGNINDFNSNKTKIKKRSKRKQFFCLNNKLRPKCQAARENPMDIIHVSKETVDLCNKDATADTPVLDNYQTYTTTKKRKYNSYCCWYNKKWKHLTNKNIRPKEHPCPPSQCTCCCKEEYEIELYTKTGTPVSRLKSGQNKKIKQYKASKMVTRGMNTDFSPDFPLTLLEASKMTYEMSTEAVEEVFYSNNAFREIECQTVIHAINTEPDGFSMAAPTPIITSVQSLSQTIDTAPALQEEGDAKQTKCKTNLIYSAGPYYLNPPDELNKPIEEPTNKFNTSTVNKVFSMDDFKKSLPQSPLTLGKNKILLCSLKPVNKPDQNIVQNNVLQPQIKNNKILPPGMQIMLLQNNELKLSIENGVNLNSTQLKKLPSILASVQKELNIEKALRQGLKNNRSNKSNLSVAWDSLVSLLNGDDSFNMNMCSQAANEEIINIREGSNDGISELVTNDCDVPTAESVVEYTSESETIDKNTINSIEGRSEPIEKINETNSENHEGDILDEETTSLPDKNAALEQVILNDETIVENEENAAATSTQASAKTTILSDLMQMSGISFEDTFALNNEVPEITGEDASSTSPDILNTRTFDHSSTKVSPNYGVHFYGANDGTSVAPDKSLLKSNLGLELNIITSFKELKYAYENSAQFYKLDVDTGKIVSINVKIKKHNPPIEKRTTPLHTKTVIDLTDDCEKEEQNITSAKLEIPKVIKPIRLSKPLKPLILNRVTNILKQPDEGEPSKKKKKIIRILKKVKNDSNISNQDKVSKFLSPEILEVNNDLTNESDDEPLASKAKRKKVISDHESKSREENTCEENEIEIVDKLSKNDLNTEGTTKSTVNLVEEPEAISKNPGDDSTERKPTYKYCIVPLCKNTVRNAPNKIFFLVPRGEAVRKKWCEIMKRSMVSSSTCLYCCEDHFDLEEDTANYIQYKIMNLQEKQKTILRLKKGVVPHKFQCQKESEVPSPSEKNAYKNRKHSQIIEESLTASSSNCSESTSKLISN